MSVFSPVISDNLCGLYNLIYAVDFVEYNSSSISVCQEFFFLPNLVQAVQGHSAPLCVGQY